MPDPDAYKAGGSTGALSRATQLANQRAANAARAADMLRRRTPPKPPKGKAPGKPIPAGPSARVFSPPPPSEIKMHHDPFGRLVGPDGKPIQGPGFNEQVSVGGIPEILGSYTNPEPATLTPDTTTPRAVDEKTGKPGTPLPGTAGAGYVGIADWQKRDAPEVNRYLDLPVQQQEQVRRNVKETAEGGKVAKTVNQMLDDIKKDPLQNADRFLAGQDLANAFRDDTKAKYFTDQDLTENPFLATLNDLSVWSTYRLKNAAWQERKHKMLGPEGDGGDGTYPGLVDSGSFSDVTGAGNLSPYLVIRDEHGLLHVETADKWIQAKFAEMRHDPELAANMITAMAMTSAYGSDSTAEAQRTRIVTDANGNPVKAFVSSEDLSALKQLANQVAILQNQGDEVAIDDSIAELTAQAADVTAQEQANGDFGSGGKGGYGHGGGGYGGGGSGGGGAVRYTDATQLTSLVGSIGRQRMGRELTADEAAQFVAYYHGLEEQNTAAYYAGQSNTQLDPEGQAVAWVTGHFGQEAAANQYGNLAAQFVQMMGSSQFLPGVS